MGPHMIGLIMDLLPGFPNFLLPPAVLHSNITGFPIQQLYRVTCCGFFCRYYIGACISDRSPPCLRSLVVMELSGRGFPAQFSRLGSILTAM